MLLTTTFIADARSKRPVIINENYGTVMSYDQFKKLEQEGQVKTIDTRPDTVRVTLKGPKIHIPAISEYNRCYSANLSVNGRKHIFKSEMHLL